MASYAEALQQQGEWLVRIEDIDPTRELAGAADSILRTLETHGFEFATPVYQSTRTGHYREHIADLLATGAAFPCSCSRQSLLATAARGRAGIIYPGTCRNGPTDPASAVQSIRLLTAGVAAVEFTDRLQGPQSCDVATQIGDFLLQRGDGHIAYQLAVAVDDAEQHISEVVRGTDLLDSTFMQLLVMQKLGLQAPSYAHVPVVTGTDGSKLSKQTGATELNNNQPNINILRALSLLLQEPPVELKTASLDTLWAWVREHWDSSRFRGVQSRPERSIMSL